jgi:hypothetical protein
LSGHDVLERTAQRAERLRALFSMRAICSCVRSRRLADRVQHRLDGLLAIGEVAQRLRLLLAEQLVRERQERLRVAAQGTAGDGVKP